MADTNRRPGGLGRRYAPDERDRRFPLRAAIPRRVPVRTRYWRTGPVLNQEDTPQCVGYAWRAFLDAAPLMSRGRGPSATEIYNVAQELDEWEDTPPAGGSSVRAGAKALVRAGLIEGQYLWGANAKDARDFVLTRGLVVFGTLWYPDMYETDRKGFVHIGGGEAEDGHAYASYGYSVSRRAFRCLQSWPLPWGDRGRGRFWLHEDDAERLIRDEGEVASAVEQEVVSPIA